MDSSDDRLTEDQKVLIDKVAKKIVDRGMSVPAILFLESVKPLSFLGSQLLVFLNPMIQAVLNLKEYDELTKMLEERENVERLIVRIEELEAQSK